MSLIEKALNQARTKEPLEAQEAILAPRPERVLLSPRSTPRIGLYAAGALLFLVGLLGGWALMGNFPKGGKRLSHPIPPPLASKAQEASSEQTQAPAPRQQEQEPPSQLKARQPEESSGPVTSASASQAKEAMPDTPARPQPAPSKGPSPTGPPMASAARSAGEPSPPKGIAQEARPSAPRAPRGQERPSQGFSSSAERKQVLRQRAYLSAQAGHYGAAIAIYDELLRIDPKDGEALLNRGVLRARSGDLPGARDDLLRAKQLRPQDPSLWNALGAVYLEMGDAEQAGFYLRLSGEPAALINLALLHWRKGEHERAMATLVEAEVGNPLDPYVPYYRALLLKEQGRLKEAEAETDKARSLAQKRGDLELLRRIESAASGP